MIKDDPEMIKKIQNGLSKVIAGEVLGPFSSTKMLSCCLRHRLRNN